MKHHVMSAFLWIVLNTFPAISYSDSSISSSTSRQAYDCLSAFQEPVQIWGATVTTIKETGREIFRIVIRDRYLEHAWDDEKREFRWFDDTVDRAWNGGISNKEFKSVVDAASNICQWSLIW